MWVYQVGEVGFRRLTTFLCLQSYKALVLLNYFVVVYLFSWIPFIGGPISFLYACIVDSYYCYE